MKKTLCLLAFSAITLGALAQDSGNNTMDDTHKKGSKMHSGMMKDCVMMEDGKMMVMKGGSNMAMDQDMTLTNGTVVKPDGTMTMKNGKTMTLKNGQCVYMNGKMGSMKMHSGMHMKNGKM